MTQPISVALDLANHVGYVAFQSVPEGQSVSHNERVSDEIVLDLAQDGSVIGIELLWLDDETFARARDVANARGLAFPTLGMPQSA